MGERLRCGGGALAVCCALALVLLARQALAASGGDQLAATSFEGYQNKVMPETSTTSSSTSTTSQHSKSNEKNERDNQATTWEEPQVRRLLVKRAAGNSRLINYEHVMSARRNGLAGASARALGSGRAGDQARKAFFDRRRQLELMGASGARSLNVGQPRRPLIVKRSIASRRRFKSSARGGASRARSMAAAKRRKLAGSGARRLNFRQPQLTYQFGGRFKRFAGDESTIEDEDEQIGKSFDEPLGDQPPAASQARDGFGKLFQPLKPIIPTTSAAAAASSQAPCTCPLSGAASGSRHKHQESLGLNLDETQVSGRLVDGNQQLSENFSVGFGPFELFKFSHTSELKKNERLSQMLAHSVKLELERERQKASEHLKLAEQLQSKLNQLTHSTTTTTKKPLPAPPTQKPQQQHSNGEPAHSSLSGELPVAAAAAALKTGQETGNKLTGSVAEITSEGAHVKAPEVGVRGAAKPSQVELKTKDLLGKSTGVKLPKGTHERAAGDTLKQVTGGVGETGEQLTGALKGTQGAAEKLLGAASTGGKVDLLDDVSGEAQNLVKNSKLGATSDALGGTASGLLGQLGGSGAKLVGSVSDNLRGQNARVSVPQLGEQEGEESKLDAEIASVKPNPAALEGSKRGPGLLSAIGDKLKHASDSKHKQQQPAETTESSSKTVEVIKKVEVIKPTVVVKPVEETIKVVKVVKSEGPQVHQQQQHEHQQESGGQPAEDPLKHDEHMREETHNVEHTVSESHKHSNNDPKLAEEKISKLQEAFGVQFDALKNQAHEMQAEHDPQHQEAPYSQESASTVHEHEHENEPRHEELKQQEKPKHEEPAKQQHHEEPKHKQEESEQHQAQQEHQANDKDQKQEEPKYEEPVQSELAHHKQAHHKEAKQEEPKNEELAQPESMHHKHHMHLESSHHKEAHHEPAHQKSAHQEETKHEEIVVVQQEPAQHEHENEQQNQSESKQEEPKGDEDVKHEEAAKPQKHDESKQQYHEEVKHKHEEPKHQKQAFQEPAHHKKPLAETHVHEEHQHSESAASQQEPADSEQEEPEVKQQEEVEVTLPVVAIVTEKQKSPAKQQEHKPQMLKQQHSQHQQHKQPHHHQVPHHQAQQQHHHQLQQHQAQQQHMKQHVQQRPQQMVAAAAPAPGIKPLVVTQLQAPAQLSGKPMMSTKGIMLKSPLYESPRVDKLPAKCSAKVHELASAQSEILQLIERVGQRALTDTKIDYLTRDSLSRKLAKVRAFTEESRMLAKLGQLRRLNESARSAGVELMRLANGQTAHKLDASLRPLALKTRKIYIDYRKACKAV